MISGWWSWHYGFGRLVWFVTLHRFGLRLARASCGYDFRGLGNLALAILFGLRLLCCWDHFRRRGFSFCDRYRIEILTPFSIAMAFPTTTVSSRALFCKAFSTELSTTIALGKR